MHYLIRDLNKDEKPRERLKLYGATNLSDEELLALVVRSGGKGLSAVDLGRQIINKFGGLHGLIGVELEELVKTKFIDVAKAASLAACIEIATRIATKQNNDTMHVSKPENIVKLLKKDLIGKQKEHLYLITLNSRNKLIAKDLIAIGTVNETLLSVREIFKQAFLRNAVSMIIAHNHPSNDPTPSDEDILATNKIAKAATEISIPLLDHVVIAETSFVSMKAEGHIKKV